MSIFSERVLQMTEREMENGDWAIVHQALVDAQKKLAEFGAGRQTWLDAPIAIAKERSNTNKSEKKGLNPSSSILKNAIVCGAGLGAPSFAEYQQMFQLRSNRCFILLSTPSNYIQGKSPLEIQKDVGLPWDDGTDEGIYFDAILAHG